MAEVQIFILLDDYRLNFLCHSPFSYLRLINVCLLKMDTN